MGWQQLSQRAASSETKHLPVTPALVTVCCHSWLGPSTQRMNVSIPWHQTKAVFWHVCKLLTSTYTERAVFRWKGASQEAHTSVIKGTVIMWVLLSAQQFLLQWAVIILPHGMGGWRRTMTLSCSETFPSRISKDLGRIPGSNPYDLPCGQVKLPLAWQAPGTHLRSLQWFLVAVKKKSMSSSSRLQIQSSLPRGI